MAGTGYPGPPPYPPGPPWSSTELPPLVNQKTQSGGPKTPTTTRGQKTCPRVVARLNLVFSFANDTTRNPTALSCKALPVLQGYLAAYQRQGYFARQARYVLFLDGKMPWAINESDLQASFSISLSYAGPLRHLPAMAKDAERHRVPLCLAAVCIFPLMAERHGHFPGQTAARPPAMARATPVTSQMSQGYVPVMSLATSRGEISETSSPKSKSEKQRPHFIH